MELQALEISFRLAMLTSLLLLPIGIGLGRVIAWSQRSWVPVLQSVIFLPLVLPPTVLGYYFLVAFSGQAPLGRAWESLFNSSLNFSFQGLLIASIIANLPFTVQPIQHAFSAIDRELRDAARTCGLTPWQTFCKIELPLIWPGLAGAFVLTFAHTLGEFGVVLMVGGNLAGETRTLSIAIYDQVQAFNLDAAGQMALVLLTLAFMSLLLLQSLGQFRQRRKT
ncbi:molybdate ABC transporter permease subunit [Nitrincola nitratireducens]|uniref:Molybdenum transport system permease n=1 Tax=Nitrincola nitratireducens TaxID=1229521 RepID=W9V0A3_9GAMM|nr:molybdate ABC transporter permease subunit [Nitrincola nitratireducens]EXJ09567.1 Molybdenum transport system permease protein modB [Nitrincola nitratireducens]